jgi:hypothetical protein
MRLYYLALVPALSRLYMRRDLVVLALRGADRPGVRLLRRLDPRHQEGLRPPHQRLERRHPAGIAAAWPLKPYQLRTRNRCNERERSATGRNKSEANSVR